MLRGAPLRFCVRAYLPGRAGLAPQKGLWAATTKNAASRTSPPPVAGLGAAVMRTRRWCAL